MLCGKWKLEHQIILLVVAWYIHFRYFSLKRHSSCPTQTSKNRMTKNDIFASSTAYWLNWCRVLVLFPVLGCWLLGIPAWAKRISYGTTAVNKSQTQWLLRVGVLRMWRFEEAIITIRFSIEIVIFWGTVSWKWIRFLLHWILRNRWQTEIRTDSSNSVPCKSNWCGNSPVWREQQANFQKSEQMDWRNFQILQWKQKWLFQFNFTKQI